MNARAGTPDLLEELKEPLDQARSQLNATAVRMKADHP
jgi:hypothetical protein